MEQDTEIQHQNVHIWECIVKNEEKGLQEHNKFTGVQHMLNVSG